MLEADLMNASWRTLSQHAGTIQNETSNGVPAHPASMRVKYITGHASNWVPAYPASRRVQLITGHLMESSHTQQTGGCNIWWIRTTYNGTSNEVPTHPANMRVQYHPTTSSNPNRQENSRILGSPEIPKNRKAEPIRTHDPELYFRIC